MADEKPKTLNEALKRDWQERLAREGEEDYFSGNLNAMGRLGPDPSQSEIEPDGRDNQHGNRRNTEDAQAEHQS